MTGLWDIYDLSQEVGSSYKATSQNSASDPAALGQGPLQQYPATQGRGLKAVLIKHQLPLFLEAEAESLSPQAQCWPVPRCLHTPASFMKKDCSASFHKTSLWTCKCQIPMLCL